MTNLIIDLSVPMEKNNGEIADFEFRQTEHGAGGDIFGRNLAFSRKGTVGQTLTAILGYFTGKKKISRESFPQKEFLNMEVITASTHTGTHFDAPLHFGSISEGNKAVSVDMIPIEWCFRDGVVLDLTFKKPGEFILPKDIESSLKQVGYVLKPYDIVLIRTGADKYWGMREYLERYPGMSREAVEYLINRGIKIIGIDSYGFDRPFSNMIHDYFQTKENSFLFPAHFYGREKTYCHIERLTNLDKLPRPHGFKVACFPIKIRNAGAAWVRAAAIF